VPAGFVVPPAADLGRVSDAELAEQIAAIGGFPVAVRSSGTLEDLADASFAGQYETYLEVSGVEELRVKIAACRASAGNERVTAYLAHKGLSAAAAEVAVLVQRMVEAKVSGVAFSIDPVTGREEHALVECCAGLGERLVSGYVTPTRATLALRDGGIVEQTAGEDKVVLEAPLAVELVARLLEIQAFFGTPQDVEWAVDGEGKLWILQARPITRVQFRTDVEELTNADFKDGGISARVCTPMMYSLYQNALQVSMQTYFEDLGLVRRPERWISMYYGRGYWNASAVKRALGKVPGFSEEKFDQDLGIQKSYGEKGPVTVPTTVGTVLPAIPVAFKLERSYKRQLEVVKKFAPEFAVRRQSWLAKIAGFSATNAPDFFRDLEKVLFDFHAWTERSYFTTIYNNANAQSDFKSFLAKMDAAIGRTTSLVTLMGGLADVRHMDMQRGIVKLAKVAKADGFEGPAWELALRGFLADYGFHSDAELDITVPRWSEVPARIVQLVEQILASGVDPVDPDVSVASQKAAFEVERDAIRVAVRKRLGLRLRFASGFEGHLARMRAYLSAREEMREYSTQCYAIVRSYLLEAGRRLTVLGRLPKAADIFMLSIEQVRDLVGGRLSLAAAENEIAFRKAMYDGYRDFAAPNELGASVEQRTKESYLAAADGKRVLAGLGCSAKQVEGTVRVVTSLDEVHVIRRGDILVTKTTDPGWTPVLGLVAGVVTEVGGMLSHAAVIGREYGIPAVLNLPGATAILKTGMKVRVDGATGLVEILAEATETEVAA
jgi:phosphohistidine swiveling domain-containing protein